MLTRQLQISVTDMTGASSAVETVQLSLSVPEFPITVTTATTTPQTYLENAAPLVIDPTMAVESLDSRKITGATWTFTSNYSPDQDQLIFSDLSGITGNWDAATGTLSLSGEADATVYESILSSVAYINNSAVSYTHLTLPTIYSV